MLVLLTKRKLRPDGCQTVKPPGILAMPNIFSPPFFFRKLLRWVQDFFRIPRMFADGQTNAPNPLKFILWAAGSQACRPCSAEVPLRPDPDHRLLHNLCSPQCCQGGTTSSYCKQNPTGWTCQESSRRFFIPLGLLLVCSKQVKNHLEEQGVLDAAACGLPSDALLIWGPNLK